MGTPSKPPVFNVFSDLLTIVRAIRARRHSHRLLQTWGVSALSKQLAAHLGLQVKSGPFEGLLLPPQAIDEHLGPFLLGTYEHELHGVWPEIPAATLVVNIGSNMGYYAVGLARRLGCPAVAIDPDPWARRATRAMARINGVDRIDVKRFCRRSWLATIPAGTLVMSDCDGYEVELLRPPVPAGVAHATLVVETHDVVQQGAARAVIGALEPTHHVVIVPSIETPPASPIDLGFLDEKDRTLARSEIREPQSWLVCRPRR